MDVSIIIVNYNTKQLTIDCINSIFCQTRDVAFEIILVDNASTDGSIEFFQMDDRIKFVQSTKNLGFGKANNLGIEFAEGKYVFFLNSDTLLINNAVKLMYDFMECHRQKLNIGALGCLLLDANSQRTHSFAPFLTMMDFLKAEWSDHLLKRFGSRHKRLEEGFSVDDKAECFPVDYVTGADLFVAREVIDKYGGFDPDFFMYFEETEMQYRWSRRGLQSYIITTPQIVHLEGGSHQKTSSAKEIRLLKSMLIYFKKTNSRPKYYIFRVIFLFGRLLTLPMQHFTSEEKKEYVKIIAT